MNKKQVAERLQVSVRRVEALASESRLGAVTYVRGKTGKQADFAEAEVERLRLELETPDTSLIEAPNRRAAGLARLGDNGAEFVQLLAAAITQATARNHVQTVSDAAHKLTLSVADAAQLCGLSKESLRAAIHAGTLKAQVIAGRRGFTIKRADLDKYVTKL
jgi:excisionase family DNA binding protein